MGGDAAGTHVLSVLPAGIAAAVLCVLAVAEIAVMPGAVLPGGMVTLLAGALAGAGRAPLFIAVPVAAAVLAGDHLAYRSGPAVVILWRWRGSGRAGGQVPPWLAAAVPCLAGSAGMPYPGFAARLLVLRLPWLAGMLSAGALGVPLVAGGGPGAAAVAAVAVIAVPAVCGRLPVRVTVRRPRLRPAWLLLAAASLAAVACGSLVQDAAADEQTARLDPRVAGLLASHVHPDTASKAASFANLTEPPALWFMLAMAVMFLNVKRRGGSTARITAATGASLGAAAALNAALPGWDRQEPVSLGAAAVAALGITTALFARRWLDPRGAKIAVAGLWTAAAGFMLAMAIAGQSFSTLAAGACLGTAVTATVEAAARTRWGRRLADQAPARGTAPSPPGR